MELQVWRNKCWSTQGICSEIEGARFMGRYGGCEGGSLQRQRIKYFVAIDGKLSLSASGERTRFIASVNREGIRRFMEGE